MHRPSNVDLLLYDLVVVFVLVHGPLTDIQWKAAISRLHEPVGE
jgi:hypothetical protein